MLSVEIPKTLKNIISFLYRFGIWHRGQEVTITETGIKLFYSFYYLLLPISIVTAAIKCDTRDESIFLSEAAIISIISLMKLLYLIWKKKEILELLERIGVYSVEKDPDFTLVAVRLKKFTKFIDIFLVIVSAGGFLATLLPIIRSEKKLYVNFEFPMDYRNHETAFWVASAFFFTEMCMTIIAMLFSTLIWYLMMTCASRYQVLRFQIKEIGVIIATEATNKEKETIFFRDLIAAIDNHQYLRELIQQLESFCSNVFFVQIITSGLSICGSIYSLAFNFVDTFVEQFVHVVTLFYYISEILMVMYFGNEIKFSSDRLSYGLFESEWVDQPQSSQKYVVIFGELLQRPHELVIGTLYPLTLETFTTILNLAYSSFNILKNVK